MAIIPIKFGIFFDYNYFIRYNDLNKNKYDLKKVYSLCLARYIGVCIEHCYSEQFPQYQQ